MPDFLVVRKEDQKKFLETRTLPWSLVPFSSIPEGGKAIDDDGKEVKEGGGEMFWELRERALYSDYLLGSKAVESVSGNTLNRYVQHDILVARLVDRKEDLKHDRQFWTVVERIRNDFLVEGGVWYAGKVMENGGEAVEILPFRLYSDLISRLSLKSWERKSHVSHPSLREPC